MTALNDAERAHAEARAAGSDRALPVKVETPSAQRTGKLPSWLPSRRFIYAVIAIGGMQLLATMSLQRNDRLTRWAQMRLRIQQSAIMNL